MKIEAYDENRELIMSYELMSYKYGGKSHQPSADDKGDKGYPKIAGFELPVIILFLIIIFIIILVGILIGIRRRKRKRLEKVLAMQRTQTARTYQNTPATIQNTAKSSIQPATQPITQPTPIQNVKFEAVDDDINKKKRYSL